MRIAILGGGVSAMSAAYHLVELWRADGTSEPLTIRLIAPLVPDEGSDASGVGGKAMSRSFIGRYDHAHGGLDRVPFYGPMMPERGVVPHGYHILWRYPNLHRMVGPRWDELLRPTGGANAIASFQGLQQDPAPGGPGIGLMGLCDPLTGEAFRLETRVLFALQAGPIPAVVTAGLELLAAIAAGGVDPLTFSDLFYAHEVDLEMRLALIAASVRARTTNPEEEEVEGKKLYTVEYDVWAKASVEAWAGLLGPVVHATQGILQKVRALVALVESELEREQREPEAPTEPCRPDDPEWRAGAGRWLAYQTERVLRDVPGAIVNLAAGDYEYWRTLHFRFAPDATFTSPYSFDAAQALRSLAFCFARPEDGRIRSVDGARIQELWKALWGRMREGARAAGVTLDDRAGWAHSVVGGDHGLDVRTAEVRGHDHELGWPHTPSIDASLPGTPVDEGTFDAVIPCMSPAALQCVLPGDDFAPVRERLEPLRVSGNPTLELMMWTREPIQWSEAARVGLRNASITGLDGPFCLVADYRCGLWSEEALAKEDPFGDGAFAGSVLETCGAFSELYSCPTRDDAYGWPADVKLRLRRLLSTAEQFSETDPRPWPQVDDAEWVRRNPVADGTWTRERARSAEGLHDWQEASRWLAWGWVRQLSLIRSLGAQAVRQLAALATLLDPNALSRADILNPSDELRRRVRYVVMRNVKPRNRIFSPGAGSWPLRPVSGLSMDADRRLFPAGEWTRNGLDIVCMEAACLSGMRAARGAFERVTGRPVPESAPGLEPVGSRHTWYGGTDPAKRG
jgi:hypothetical protein